LKLNKKKYITVQTWGVLNSLYDIIQYFKTYSKRLTHFFLLKMLNLLLHWGVELNMLELGDHNPMHKTMVTPE